MLKMISRKKRYKKIAIFSVSTQKDNIANFIYYLLNDLKKNYHEIFIVSSGVFTNQVRENLNNYVEGVMEAVSGNDFDRWKKVFFYLIDSGKINECSDITFLNDTFYGPIYPLENVWHIMTKKRVDFWGITRHQAMPGNSADADEIKPFVQTYFINFKVKNVQYDLTSFLKKTDDYNQPEYYLTTYLEKRNHKSDVFVHTNDLENRQLELAESYLLFYPYILVKERKCPFISRYLFTLEEEILQLYGIGLQIPRLLDFIEDKYPVDYIYQDLIYQHNMYELIHSLDLNYVVDCDRDNKVPDLKKKSVVFVYLYYEKTFEEYIKKMIHIPNDVEVYIYTDKKYKVQMLKKLICKKKINAVIIQINGRGREWAVLLNEIKEVAGKYDYACFMHDKSFHDFEFPTQAYSFRDLLWDNLLPSKNGIHNIIDIFEKNNHIGILLPPIVKHGSYFKYYMNFWTNNFENTLELAKKICVRDTLFDSSITPISIGGMFWFRVDALKLLFDMNFTREDFPEEPLPVDGTINHALERIIPYVAQEQGYYSGIVMTQQYLKHDWLVQADIIRKMGKYIGNVKNSLYDLLNNE